MPNPKISLEPDRTYHIFNHAVGSDQFFLSEDNYRYFLRKVKQWILPVADIYAFCLMPNHFHFILKIKEAKILQEMWDAKIEKRSLAKEYHSSEKLQSQILIMNDLIIEQFSHCFNSYAQAYNKMYNRMGSLFKQSFQRKLIDSQDYLLRVICYTHNNPVNHHFVKKNIDWHQSSYLAYMQNKPTFVLREEVIDFFGGMDNMIYLHNKFLKDDSLRLEV